MTTIFISSLWTRLSELWIKRVLEGMVCGKAITLLEGFKEKPNDRIQCEGLRKKIFKTSLKPPSFSKQV